MNPHDRLVIGEVRVRYGRKPVVDARAVQFQPGTLTALLGPNGAGKSSWLKALIGAVPADISKIEFGAQDWLSLSPKIRAAQLSYLSQTRIGPPLLTVREIIRLGRHPFGGKDAGGVVETTLSRLDLVDLADRPFGTLSGGEQARVLLGRALAVDAPIILADEPIASLDPYYAHSMLRELRTEAQKGRIVIASLHDLALAETYCDHALIMHDGQIAASGSIQEVLNLERLRDIFKIRRAPSGTKAGAGFAPLT